MAATMEDLRAFVTNAPGQYFDPDGAYKFQCKDVIDAMCLALWGDWTNTIRPGNANVCRTNYNPEFFDWIPNVVGDETSFPVFGDVVVFDGDASNPAGHIAVTVKADYYSMYVLEQNTTGLANTPAEYGVLGYDQPGTGPCLGWLRPKVAGRSVVVVPDPALPAQQSLNVIDVSNHQAGLDVAATGAQAVVMKATEGVGWQDPELGSHCSRVRAAGLRAGFYHFARLGEQDGNTPEAEAQTFIDAVRPLFQAGDKVYLDFEAKTMDLSRGDLAKRWLDIVSQAFGTQAVFYTYLNVLTTHADSLAVISTAGYKLWLAVYPTTARQSWGPVNAMPDVPGWQVEMWQYSSAGSLPGWADSIDLNVFYGLGSDWVAGTAGVTPPAMNGPAPIPGRCTVVSGDTLSGIADRYSVTLAAMIAANPGIEPDWIYPGMVLNVPGNTVLTQAVTPSTCQVVSGDTLFGIAVQFGVNLDDLIRVNGIRNANLIYPGMVLILPGAPAAPAPERMTQVRVDEGDSMGSIAAFAGISLQELIDKNPQIQDPNHIEPGWVLAV